jgi:hypothetical protein
MSVERERDAKLVFADEHEARRVHEAELVKIKPLEEVHGWSNTQS